MDKIESIRKVKFIENFKLILCFSSTSKHDTLVAHDDTLIYYREDLNYFQR